MQVLTRSLFKRSFSTQSSLLNNKTALYDLHVQKGGKMVPFAGYEMPVQYSDMGIIESHLHTRKSASLFDVSHMGQLKFTGKDRNEFIERVTVVDTQVLNTFQGCYSLITNEQGGVIDDTIITNAGDFLYVVVNAACKDKDLQHFNKQLEVFRKSGKDVKMEEWSNRSLIALQGPKSEAALQRHTKGDLSNVTFFNGGFFEIGGVQCYVQRSGYTGEDGFEISIPTSHVVQITKSLLEEPEVKPAGLGARDTLRLEAGLCLYGHELDDTTTPKQAGIQWTISKRRAEKGGFIGDSKILPELPLKLENLPRRRVGLTIDRVPAREGVTIHNPDTKEQIGVITSGTMSPSLRKPIAIGYVKPPFISANQTVSVNVRGKFCNATITKLPFVPTNYKTK